MTANNPTLDPIPAPSPENTEQLGFTVGVGPDQTVTTRPACRRWGHFKPSRLDLPTPVVGPSRTANPGPDQTVRATWARYTRDLGINLARAREAIGLSQERVAHAAGISTFTYRKLEKGESNPGSSANPRLRTLVALAEVLETDVNAILPGNSPSIAAGRT
ncbi:helix-turn-helix domain-containing protein [Nakamurella multipartita]|uniref:helix-turn-helix domain-containing protein n=1 Tax=Nakamurella multipartita TaxID=53461 RepID=UPI0010FEA1A8|nr:helix-turn-helix transcriptional regulator [Nakamurella multipartita]